MRNILGILILPILFILKLIGDFIIFVISIFLYAISKTYKLILNTIKQSKVNILKLSKSITSLPGKIKPKHPSVLPNSLQSFFFKAKYFILGIIVSLALVFAYFANLEIKSLANPAFLTSRDIAATTKIYDRNDKLLYEIYAVVNRTPIKLFDVPQYLVDATIAIEDKDFFNHQGFSIRGILRAIIHNLSTGSREGGSTITQQLVRSALLTPEKSITRKTKELILAIWAEQLYSKDTILEMYLNQVPYGGTAWGVEAAAQTYFGKTVADLNLAESALLAGLPAAPSMFSPFGTSPKLAKFRQVEVLNRMVEEGFLGRDEAEAAIELPLNYKAQSTAIAAPHFVMYVKDLLEQYYGPRIVATAGLRVSTSLDLSLQEMAQKIVTEEINNLSNLNVGNGAALITDPNTGEIQAMVGSIDYFDIEKGGNNNITLSLQQPGSSIKVVNYAAALKSNFTAASILEDSPITYKIANQPPYSPVNYDGRFHGRIPLRIALASSYNIPAVKVLDKIGIDAMIDQGKLMDITSWEDRSRFGLSLTLGGGEVTMLDMAKVYGSLAASGIRRDLRPILEVTNFKGEKLPLPISRNIQAVSPGIAFILSDILSDNWARTPAFGGNSSLVIPGKTVAVKTGTSDNKRDNLTIGYTPDYVVVVWVGNNDNSPMHPSLTSGVTGAAPIWHEIMNNLLENKEDKPFLPPDDVVSIPCYGREEYFIVGTEPKEGCPRIISPSTDSEE